MFRSRAVCKIKRQVDDSVKSDEACVQTRVTVFANMPPTSFSTTSTRRSNPLCSTVNKRNVPTDITPNNSDDGALPSILKKARTIESHPFNEAGPTSQTSKKFISSENQDRPRDRKVLLYFNRHCAWSCLRKMPSLPPRMVETAPPQAGGSQKERSTPCGTALPHRRPQSPGTGTPEATKPAAEACARVAKAPSQTPGAANLRRPSAARCR
jgi:hypothetical protein